MQPSAIICNHNLQISHSAHLPSRNNIRNPETPKLEKTNKKKTQFPALPWTLDYFVQLTTGPSLNLKQRVRDMTASHYLELKCYRHTHEKGLTKGCSGSRAGDINKRDKQRNMIGNMNIQTSKRIRIPP